MRIVFVDTFYWIALANPNDEWHETVKHVSRSLGPAQLISTDEVLTEFLTFYSGHGSTLRATASRLVRATMVNPNIRTVPQSRTSFERALLLYEGRADKEYSLTDCSSMEVMRENGLKEVLTHDHHFQQEGFTRLITHKIP